MTLLLLTAAVGIWAWNFRMVQQTTQWEYEINVLRRAAGELAVDDPRQMAVIQRRPEWRGDLQWDVFLPPGREYSLYLATRDIDQRGGFEGLTPRQAKLPPGKHRIQLKYTEAADGKWDIGILREGQPLLESTETPDWQTSTSFSWSQPVRIGETLQRAAPARLPLRRLAFNIPDATGSSSPRGPANGLLVWIEENRQANATR